MRNIFLLLLVLLSFAMVLPAAEKAPAEPGLVLDRTPRQYRFFRNKPLSEKQRLFREIRLVAEKPAGGYVKEDAPVNSLLMAEARKQGKKYIAGNLQKSTFANIRYARRMGFKVCLMTAKNINDVITGLILEPDCILLTPHLAKFAKDMERELLKPAHRPRSVTTWKENFESSRKRAAGTSVRILSYNILASIFGRNLSPAEDRENGIREVLMKLAPDFAGFQEMDPAWYRLLGKKIAPYAFIPQDPKRRFSGILYDATKYQYLEGDVWPYTQKDGYIRNLVYALFQDKKSGQKYIFCNTHWDLTIPKRLANGVKMAEFLRKLQEKYPSIPIVAAGDYNCNITSKEFSTFIAKSNFRDAVQTAPVKENTHLNSFFPPKYGLGPSLGKPIDHIVISGEWKPLAGKLVIDKSFFFYSDHLPVIADLSMK